MGISGTEETEKGAEKIFEDTMIKIFLHLVKMLNRSMKLNKLQAGQIKNNSPGVTVTEPLEVKYKQKSCKQEKRPIRREKEHALS